LANNLAQYYQVPHLAEFGKYYVDAMPDPRAYLWNSQDFRIIADRQKHFHDQLAASPQGPPVIINDTNLFTTNLFHKMYLGHYLEDLQFTFDLNEDLYLYCPVKVFDQDGTRLNKRIQVEMDTIYRDWLKDKNTVYLSDDPKEMLSQAIEAIDQLMIDMDKIPNMR
jgi:nicotinamide riboside kinase